MRIIIATVLAVILMVSAAAAKPSGQLHAFYGEHPEIHTQADFVRLLQSNLKFDRQSYVAIFNKEFGAQLGQFSSFDDLVQKFGSGDYEARPCTGSLENYGVDDSGSLGILSRPCYQGEWVLVHRPSGTVVVSLRCANPRHYPPRRAAEDCVEIVVHLIGGSAPAIPFIRYWGGYAVAGCGLRVAYCAECVSPLGPPAGVFYAPAISGAVGVIRLPRAMVASLKELCLGVSGYLNPTGTHDKIVEGGLAQQFRDRAGRSEFVRVQFEGHYFEFHRVSS